MSPSARPASGGLRPSTSSPAFRALTPAACLPVIPSGHRFCQSRRALLWQTLFHWRRRGNDASRGDPHPPIDRRVSAGLDGSGEGRAGGRVGGHEVRFGRKSSDVPYLNLDETVTGSTRTTHLEVMLLFGPRSTSSWFLFVNLFSLRIKMARVGGSALRGGAPCPGPGPRLTEQLDRRARHR